MTAPFSIIKKSARFLAGILLVTFITQAPLFAPAAEVQEYHLAIENHRFVPEELKVPANTKFKLIVENRDPVPEEFESIELKREKIVLPKKKITVPLGPLKPGTYKFFGDFHQDTAQGRLIIE